VVNVVYSPIPVSGDTVALTLCNRLLGYDGKVLTAHDGGAVFNIGFKSATFATTVNMAFDGVKTVDLPRDVYQVTLEMPAGGEQYVYSFVTFIAPDGAQNSLPGRLDISDAATASANATMVERIEYTGGSPGEPVPGGTPGVTDGKLTATKYVHKDCVLLGVDDSARFTVNVSGSQMTFNTSDNRLDVVNESYVDTLEVYQGGTATLDTGAGAFTVSESVDPTVRYKLSGIHWTAGADNE
jgi:hypothetical protein